MPTLHLGVIDIPYTKGTPAPRRVGVRRRAGVTSEFSAPAGGQQTTGDVAEFLEEKYHVMEVFYELHGEEIIKALSETLEDTLQNRAIGGPLNTDAFAQASSDIEKLFVDFISNEEMAGVGVPGVPTQAAQKGVNHRLAHPYAKANPARPSFRDTGLYQDSFKVWID